MERSGERTGWARPRKFAFLRLAALMRPLPARSLALVALAALAPNTTVADGAIERFWKDTRHCGLFSDVVGASSAFTDNKKTNNA